MATSERDMLAKKAEGIKQMCSKAQEELDQLKSDHNLKVCFFFFQYDCDLC